MHNITIAIDGYSSTGKSTVAKRLAKALGYVYVDSGAMYRAVTFYAMQKGLISKTYFHEQQLIEHLDAININFKFNEDLGFAEVYLNGENIENQKPYILGFRLFCQNSMIKCCLECYWATLCKFLGPRVKM